MRVKFFIGTVVVAPCVRYIRAGVFCAMASVCDDVGYTPLPLFVFNAVDSPFLCNRVPRCDYVFSTTQRKFTPYDMKATVGACATASESRETGGWGKKGERRGVVGPANLAMTRVYVRTYVRT